MSENVERKRVVIIGAGASGIAAATRLYENGIRDIVVLEAENRIGGRINTIDTEKGLLDMGAQWIHGEKDNVVYELASARKLTCDPTPELSTTTFTRSSGQLIEPKQGAKLSKIFWKLLEYPKNNATKYKNCGEFYVSFLENELNKSENADISDDLKSEFIEHCHRCLNSYDASDSWFSTSISTFDEFKLCEGNQKFAWNRTGYRALFNILMEESLKLSNGSFESDIIALNNEVERISLNDRNSSMTVECSNGRRIHTDHVVITLSVGALREIHTKLFESMPIPELKTRSINNIELGTVDKIYLEFSQPWWPKDCLGFELLWTKEDHEDYTQKGLGWVTDLFITAAVDFVPNVLCGWISGSSARTMEGLDEKFVLETIMQVLRKFLSNKFEIPDAVRIIRSTWFSNKHFRGSWSYRSLRTEAARVSALTLSTPVNNSEGTPMLLFAGEATNPHHYSTVHGAVESGWREANRLISFIEKSQKLSTDCTPYAMVTRMGRPLFFHSRSSSTTAYTYVK